MTINIAEFMPTGVELFRFLPETTLTVIATVIMVLDPLTSDKNKGVLGKVALGGLLVALWLAVLAAADPGPMFRNMLTADAYGSFFRVLVIVVGILATLCSFDYLKREGAEMGEYYALLLYSVVGQCIMANANELIMLFIGLEISSIATYVLAGCLRDDKRNNEAALKYFLLGSFATAFLLYGVAWVYGITGTTNLEEIRRVFSNREIAPSYLLAGAAAGLMFVGFAFKVSAAPFQMWAPDVYQGAPVPVTAFMSAGPKAAAFAVFMRVFLTAFEPISARWVPFVWASALATMVIGNFAALRQTNIKRLLAYSSIAHAGYVMVAITSNTPLGTSAAMFYLAAYAFMNIGAFAVVTLLSGKDEQFVEVDNLRGLGVRQPATAALLTIFLLSLIGIPLTGGFFGKFYIFKAALDANLIWLAILGLLNSAVAAYYYLRIIVVMYMHEPLDEFAPPSPGAGLNIVLWGSAAATLFLGIFPAPVLDWASKSTGLLK